MGANEYQIGGDHYNKHDYQHWNLVCDTNLHYLLGCATKYVSRWRDKNGSQDLIKANHYISKALECDIWPPGMETIEDQIMRFINQLKHKDDQELITLICSGEYEEAQKMIYKMLNEAEPNNNYIRG